MADGTVFVTHRFVTGWAQIFCGWRQTQPRLSLAALSVVHWELILFLDTLLACYKGRLDYVRIFLFLYWFIRKKGKYEMKREAFHFGFFHVFVREYIEGISIVPDASITA